MEDHACGPYRTLANSPQEISPMEQATEELLDVIARIPNQVWHYENQSTAYSYPHKLSLKQFGIVILLFQKFCQLEITNAKTNIYHQVILTPTQQERFNILGEAILKEFQLNLIREVEKFATQLIPKEKSTGP